MDQLTRLMQRYCFAYTATHDFTVADQIMADDYRFQMGEHVFTGREEFYKPAADRQFKAYPGLGFIVHDFFSNGNRCAMYFSEYGRSAQYDAETVWHGVSLYRWNGQRLTECRIEQDYYGRRRQLLTKPDVVDQPAFAPWAQASDAPDVACEKVARTWLESGGLLRSKVGSLDDESAAPDVARVMFGDETVEVLDIMSAGPRVAFQVKISGTYVSGLPELANYVGVSSFLFATGIAQIEGNLVSRVRGVTDRYTMERRTLAAVKA